MTHDEPAPAIPDTTPRGDRHGPLQPGDLVQLTDPKGRHHTFPLVPGKTFHSHKGALQHDDLIGQPEGVVVSTASGVPYLVLRPLLRDFVLSMPRGATVVYPKDAAAIVGLADLFPGATVVEAGVGSGALTCSLLRADGRFTEPYAQELMLRTWHLEGLAVRPDHRMTGHTGFLLASRRLAPGTVLPARRTRPAKGAYGDDYDGPGSPAAGTAGTAPGAGGTRPPLP